MERRQLGQTDLAITRIGLGAWAIGGGDWCLGWGPQNDTQSIATLRRALEEGINWIETAGAYGLGRSETHIARVVRPIPARERPYVFTTAGLVWDDLGNVSSNLTAASIRRQAEDSLRRLRVDAIDLYQVDVPHERCPLPKRGTIEEAWDAMAQLQQDGKVRWIGVTNGGVRELNLERVAPVASLQRSYSLLQRDPEHDLLPYLPGRTGMLAAATMESGLLTGTMNAERLGALPHNDWRRCSPAFHPQQVARAQVLVDRLRAVGRDHGVVPGAVAVAWALRHPAVTAVVAGARRPEQVVEIVEAARVKLSSDEVTYLEAGGAKPPGLLNGGPLDMELLHARLERGALHPEPGGGARRAADDPPGLAEGAQDMLALGVLKR